MSSSGTDEEPATTDDGVLAVRLALPDVRSLGDAEVARRFPALDGRWSEQTKGLVRSFGATGLDLNANWADVSVDWWCKCCARTKPAIVRKSEAGILLAHLHLHHDHLREHLGGLLNERFGIPWMDGVPLPSRHADEHMRALVERFRATLVCDACNGADGIAKSALRDEVHENFSFAPSEITRFVRPRPNALHDVDVEAARRIWRDVREEFEDRLAFAGSLVGRLAAGRLSVERGPDSVRAYKPVAADLMLDGESGRRASGLTAYLAWRGRIGIDIIERSVARDGAGRSGRARQAREAKANRPRTPTDTDLAAFEARAQSGWRKTPADWACPCCGRGKRGIMRIGKSGDWFGQIRIHYGSVPETDAGNLRFRVALYPHHQASPVVGGRRQDFVCSDCGDVVSELQRSRPDLRRSVLTLDDLRDCLGEVRDNVRTVPDLDAAAVRSEANFDLANAESEFMEHQEVAVGLWTMFDKLGRHHSLHPLLVAQARDANVDVKGTQGALGWLLRQGRRFVNEQRANDAPVHERPAGI